MQLEEARHHIKDLEKKLGSVGKRSCSVPQHNYIRPHQSLDYLTPYEYYQQWLKKQCVTNIVNEYTVLTEDFSGAIKQKK